MHTNYTNSYINTIGYTAANGPNNFLLINSLYNYII